MTQTKEKLLASATEMFAEHGFNGVSTRDLVTISMVNLCSINYYFGSKQKLYDAVIDNIIDNVKENLISKIDKYKTQNTSAMNKITFIISEFFDYLFSNKISNSMVMILFRELLNTSAGGDRIYSEIMEPLKKRFVNLIIDATGTDKQTAYIKAQCLFSNPIFFRLLQNKENYSQNFLKKTKQQLVENCKILLKTTK
jgi:AcrR family transcriptional regulator